MPCWHAWKRTGRLSVEQFPCWSCFAPERAAENLLARLAADDLDAKSARLLLDSAVNIPSIDAGWGLLKLAQDTTRPLALRTQRAGKSAGQSQSSRRVAGDGRRRQIRCRHGARCWPTRSCARSCCGPSGDWSSRRWPDRSWPWRSRASWIPKCANKRSTSRRGCGRRASPTRWAACSTTRKQAWPRPRSTVWSTCKTFAGCAKSCLAIAFRPRSAARPPRGWSIRPAGRSCCCD